MLCSKFKPGGIGKRRLVKPQMSFSVVGCFQHDLSVSEKFSFDRPLCAHISSESDLLSLAIGGSSLRFIVGPIDLARTV
jgi:hypothetical protein